MKKIIFLLLLFMLFCGTCFAKFTPVTKLDGILYSVDMDNISVFEDIWMFDIRSESDNKDTYNILSVSTHKDKFKIERGFKYNKNTNTKIESIPIPSVWLSIKDGSYIREITDYVHANYKEKPVTIYKNRWALITSSKEGNSYFDVFKYRFEKVGSRNYINCWIRTETKDVDFISHMIFDVNSLSYITKETISYNKDGTIRYEWDSTDKGWKTAVPGSNMEAAFVRIVIWTSEHFNSYPPQKTSDAS